MARENLDLPELLLAAEQTLVARMQDAAPYGHTTGVGDRRESAAMEFLRRFLPEEIKLRKGRVIDSDGRMSAEFDAIAYLDGLCPSWIDESDGRTLVPIEAVLVTFEVKSYLDDGEAKKSVDAFASLAPLKRHYVETSFERQVRALSQDMVNPFATPAGAFEQRRGVPPVAGFVIYLDGLKAKTLAERLRQGEKSFFGAWGLKRRELLLRLQPDQFAAGDMATALFGATLTHLISDQGMRAHHVRPNLRRYWLTLAELLQSRTVAKAT